MSKVIYIKEIQDLLPHRYPFLLVDRIVDYRENEWAVGIKNVTINEEFFQGHFPGNPIMPGVLVVEAMAQTAGILVMKSNKKEGVNNGVYFMSIEEARFRKPIVPGDTLFIHVEKERVRDPVWKFKGHVKVNDQIVAEAKFTAMITPISESKAADASVSIL